MYTHNPLARRRRFGVLIALLSALSTSVLLSSACIVRETRVEAEPTADPLTHGNVQLTLRSGVTTKNEVLESFGAPNITTRDSEGKEVWTYQRYGRVIESSRAASYATVLLFGSQQQRGGVESSNRSMTLIITFNDDDIVDSFNSRYSSF